MIRKTRRFIIKKYIYGFGALLSIVPISTVLLSCGSLKNKILIELNNEAKQINKNQKFKNPPPKNRHDITLDNLLLYIDIPVIDINFTITPNKISVFNTSLQVSYFLMKKNYDFKIKVIVNYN